MVNQTGDVALVRSIDDNFFADLKQLLVSTKRRRKTEEQKSNHME